MRVGEHDLECARHPRAIVEAAVGWSCGEAEVVWRDRQRHDRDLRPARSAPSGIGAISIAIAPDGASSSRIRAGALSRKVAAWSSLRTRVPVEREAEQSRARLDPREMALEQRNAAHRIERHRLDQVEAALRPR